jgi:hypothetical protein
MNMNAGSRLAWIALLMLSISAAVNVLQAQRIRALEGRQASGISLVGRGLPELTGAAPTGTPRRIDLTGAQPTVLYYFSPSCGWCDRNWANLEAIAAGARGRYRVLAVTSNRGTSEYIRERRITLDVLEGLDENSRQAVGFSLSPHTIVVSADGQITHDWRGAYTPRIERQIEDVFGVLLPGVDPAAAR